MSFGKEPHAQLVVLQGVVVEVRADAPGQRHDFGETRRVLGEQALVESADALSMVLGLDLLRDLAVETAGDPGGNRDRAEHDLRLDGSDVDEITPYRKGIVKTRKRPCVSEDTAGPKGVQLEK